MLKILENKIRDRADFHRAQKRDVRRDAALDGLDVAHQPSVTPSRQLMADEARSADPTRILVAHQNQVSTQAAPEGAEVPAAE